MLKGIVVTITKDSDDEDEFVAKIAIGVEYKGNIAQHSDLFLNECSSEITPAKCTDVEESENKEFTLVEITAEKPELLAQKLLHLTVMGLGLDSMGDYDTVKIYKI